MMNLPSHHPSATQAAISVHTELVAVPVSVTDAQGHQVSGLRQDDFHIYEDGRLEPIALFHHGDVPVTLGLIVDCSQSMRRKHAVTRRTTTFLEGICRSLSTCRR